jgi:hypothetical protein
LDEKALKPYQHFKFRVVGNLPDEWTLTEKEIRKVILEVEKCVLRTHGDEPSNQLGTDIPY